MEQTSSTMVSGDRFMLLGFQWVPYESSELWFSDPLRMQVSHSLTKIQLPLHLNYYYSFFLQGKETTETTNKNFVRLLASWELTDS